MQFRLLHTIILFLILEKSSNTLSAAFDPYFNIEPSVDNPRWSDIRETLLEEHSLFCGNRRLCNEDRNVESCSVCESCYCDDICEVYGDCCLDKFIDDHLLDQLINSTETGVFGEFYTECMDLRAKASKPEVSRPDLAQRLIARCPEGFGDMNLKSECEDTGKINARMTSLTLTVTDLVANWPVFSSRSLTSFKNKACAQCHGQNDEDLVEWNLKISCDVTQNMPPSADPMAILMTILQDPTYEVAFSVPEGMDPRICSFPFTDDTTFIDRCNITGNRFNYGETLWKACEIFPATLYSLEKWYTNPFCFACQQDFRQWSGPLCSRGFDAPFFLVLSPDALRSVQEAQMTFDCRCRDGYMYDPFKDNCRKIHCATGRVLKDQTCEASVSETLGLTYSFSLSLISEWLNTSDTSFPADSLKFYELAETMKEEFVVRLADDPIKDAVDVIIVQVNSVSQDDDQFAINIYSEITTQRSQKLDELEQKYLALTQDIWEISLPIIDRKFNFTPHIITKPEASMLEYLPKNVVWVSDYTNHKGTESKAYIIVFESSNTDDWTNFGTKIYVEVKNTLMCPYLSYNMTEINDGNETDIILKKEGTNWPNVSEELFHLSTGISLSTENFSVRHNGLIIVCIEEIREEMISEYDERHGGIDGVDVFGQGLVLTSYICLGVSAVCLALTLFTYCLFPSLRTLPGKSTMILVFSLLVAISLFFVGGFIDVSSVACQAVGALTHFFLLSSFVWMLICTIHMFRVFGNVLKHAPSSQESEKRTFVLYIIISFIVPGAIVLTTAMANYFSKSSSDDAIDETLNMTVIDPELEDVTFSCNSGDDVKFGYGHGICYLSNKMSLLLAGALPIALLCIDNLVIFILTINAFRRMSADEKVAKKESRSHLLLYIKLSTLTGINWLPCTVIAFVSSSAVWYTFLVLCGLQGLYVFLSFVCNKRVLSLYTQCLHGTKTSSSSSDPRNGSGGPDKKYKTANSNTQNTNSTSCSSPRVMSPADEPNA